MAALRLAEAGIETLVLERGRRWDITPEGDTFATLGAPDHRSMWLRDTLISPGIEGLNIPVPRFTGVLDVVRAPTIDVYQGAGVGGGSLIYGCTLLQPPREAFLASLPNVDYDEMDRIYFPRARSVLGAATLPDDILATETYQFARTAFQHFANAGFAVEALPGGVDFDIVRAELRGDVAPAMIVGDYPLFGCNSGAKNSVDRNYLAQAEATGYCSVEPLCEVIHIASTHGGYAVVVDHLDDEGNAVATEVLICTSLFLAAGSIGTTKLLLDAQANGSLPRLRTGVGTLWGGNGDLLALRVGVGPTGAISGGPAPFGISVDGPTGPALLEASAGGVGSETFALVTLGMGIPDARGVLGLDPATGEITIDWPTDANNAALAGILPIHAALNEANPGSFGPVPLPNTLPTTFHPLGGASSVTDSYGRVLGHRNLFVIDGSNVPGSTGARNPALTITALAERAMERLLDDDLSS